MRRLGIAQRASGNSWFKTDGTEATRASVSLRPPWTFVRVSAILVLVHGVYESFSSKTQRMSNGTPGRLESRTATGIRHGGLPQSHVGDRSCSMYMIYGREFRS